MKLEPLCVIGDLHGRKSLLEKIVKSYPDHHYVLLGDLIHHKHFFRKYPRVSPLRIIEYAMNLESRATILMGNNEKYILERFCYPIEQIRKSEAKYTMKVLRSLDTEERLQIMRWMVNLPSSVEIEEYRFAHAYYNDPNPRLFGPGVRWYLPEYSDLYPLEPGYKYFFGHYGKPYFRDNIYILDATELDAVGVYLTDSNEFKIFV